METRPEKCPFCAAPVEGDGSVCRRCGFDLASDWRPASEDEARAVFDPGQRACTACGELNPLKAEFCSKCGAPVGDSVALKPFESIAAQGYLYRRTAEGVQVRSLAARIGMTVAALAFVGAAAVGLLAMWPLLAELSGSVSSMSRRGRWEFLPLVLMAATAAVCAGLTLLMGFLGYRMLAAGTSPLPEGDDGPGPAAGGAGSEEGKAAVRARFRPLRMLVFAAVLGALLAGLVLVQRSASSARTEVVLDHVGALDQMEWLGRGMSTADRCRLFVRLNPDDAVAHYNLGLALLDDNDLAGAAAALKEAIRLKPDHAEAHWALGNAYAARSDHAKAIAAYRQALRLDPALAAVYCNLGNSLCEIGDRDGAVEAYRQAIRLKPDFFDAQYDLGVALVGQERYEEADGPASEAVRLKPDSADAHWMLGAVRAGKKDHAGAIAEYREALRLKPGQAELHFLTGREFHDSGDFSGAMREYAEALRLNSGHLDALNDLAWLLAASPQTGQRDGPRAVELAAKLVKLQRTACSLDTLAAACAEAGRFEEAVRAEKEAIELLGDKDEKVASEYAARLKLYEVRQTYRIPEGVR